MTLLHIVAYGATALAFGFAILSLACGLYYLAELVEEYTVYTKKVIKTMTIVVVAIHFLLLFDRLPTLQLLFSVFCHGIYSLNLRTFPFIQLTSLPFISSCVLVFVDHFIWFNYFTKYYRPFMDIVSFFGVCVWLIPFTYFISLSANDNALPLSDPSAADMIPNKQKKGLFKTLFGFIGNKQDQQSFPMTSKINFEYARGGGDFSNNNRNMSYDPNQRSPYNNSTSGIPPSSSSSNLSSRSSYSVQQLQNRKAY